MLNTSELSCLVIDHMTLILSLIALSNHVMFLKLALTLILQDKHLVEGLYDDSSLWSLTQVVFVHFLMTLVAHHLPWGVILTYIFTCCGNFWHWLHGLMFVRYLLDETWHR